MENNEIKKTNKSKKFLIAFIVVLVIVLAVAIPVSLLSSKEPSKSKGGLKEAKEVKKYECTKKGEICTFKEMYEGVEVNVEVAKGKTYTFSMIANDKNTMTLMLQQNVENDVEWHDEGINLKGPQTSLYQLNELVKDWENISVIEKYSYTDKGKVDIENYCSTATNPTKYECPENQYDTRGYNGLIIVNGEVKLLFNLPPEENLEEGFEILKEGTLQTSAKARFITIEEYNEFVTDDGPAKWLIEGLGKDEGYWTMTSATKLTTGYNQAAVAIVNKKGKSSTENVPVARGNKYYKVGIRPVITIYKK